MAATKKYAGLPDLDDAGTELYQTPGLTDDASTIQTSTLRTESPTPSEEISDNFDRSRFNRDEARRRFEPTTVHAKDVNFSHAVGGTQKGYISRQRRRRKARRSNGVTEYGDISDDDDVEVEETLGQRLARLKREAEELRLEIEQRDREDGEFQDSFEHQEGGTDQEENETEFTRGVDDLSRLLGSLNPPSRSRHETLEQELSRKLREEKLPRDQNARSNGDKPDGSESSAPVSSSTITAIAAFSDRLSAIESALGLSAITPASNPTAILPTLDWLSSQINLLHTTISPRSTPSTAAATTNNNNLATAPSQMPHLDDLQSRLHTLHQSASSLLAVRKSAQTALTELETVRLRSIRSADHLGRYQNLANRRANRPVSFARTDNSYTTNNNDEDDNNNNNNNNTTNDDDIFRSATAVRPITTTTTNNNTATATDEARERIEIGDEIVTPLFLEDQSEKIKALYNLLPTIQDLQPLLPVVLERLRSLSLVHTGAATARRDLDDLEARLGVWEAGTQKWAEAVAGIEAQIEEARDVMRENLGVVGDMVGRVEERIRKLDAQ